MSTLAATYQGMLPGKFRIELLLLYAYALVYPFFVFSVVISRDTASLWLIGIMGLFLVAEVCRTGGRFWADRSLIFLLAFVFVYLLATVSVYLNEPMIRWGGRSPIERAVAVDIRVLSAVFSFIVFLNMLARVSLEEFVGVFRLTMFVGTAVALFGLLQYTLFTLFGSTALVGIESTNEAFRLRSNFIVTGGERVFRASSVYSEPSYFGFVLVPLLVKSLVAWHTGLNWTSRPLQLVVMAILTLALLVNLAFTAIVSLIILGGMAILWTLKNNPRLSIGLAGGIVIIAIVVFASPLSEAVFSRLQAVAGGKDLSALDRLVRAYSGLVVFLGSPWLGVGPGGFAFIYPQIGFFVERGHMHSPLNMWLSILTDVGLLGFMCFLGFLVSTLGRAIRNIASNPVIPVFLWSTIAYLVLLSSVDLWFLDMFWFELAALLSLATIHSKPQAGTTAAL